MDHPKNLPVIFEEKKHWGLKTSSSYQYVLDGKLTEANKQELLAFAKKGSGLSASHKQNDHLYELKGRGYVLVVDSSGPNERIHFRTTGGKKILLVNIYSAIAFAVVAMATPILMGQTKFTLILTGIISLLFSIIFSLWGPHSPKKQVKSKERRIIKMIRKLNTLIASDDLNTEH